MLAVQCLEMWWCDRTWLGIFPRNHCAHQQIHVASYTWLEKQTCQLWFFPLAAELLKTTVRWWTVYMHEGNTFQQCNPFCPSFSWWFICPAEISPAGLNNRFLSESWSWHRFKDDVWSTFITPWNPINWPWNPCSHVQPVRPSRSLGLTQGFLGTPQDVQLATCEAVVVVRHGMSCRGDFLHQLMRIDDGWWWLMISNVSLGIENTGLLYYPKCWDLYTKPAGPSRGDRPWGKWHPRVVMNWWYLKVISLILQAHPRVPISLMLLITLDDKPSHQSTAQTCANAWNLTNSAWMVRVHEYQQGESQQNTS